MTGFAFIVGQGLDTFHGFWHCRPWGLEMLACAGEEENLSLAGGCDEGGHKKCARSLFLGAVLKTLSRADRQWLPLFSPSSPDIVSTLAVLVLSS